MRFRLHSLLCLLACAAAARGGPRLTRDEAIKRFTEANRLYEAGETAASQKHTALARRRFQEALRAYEALVAAGCRNGQLFFNLGDAYYRLGRIGKAIVNYRRAQRLLPRSAAVEENLRLARRKLEDKPLPLDAPELARLAAFWYFYLTLDELLVALLAAYGVLMALLFALVFSRRPWLKPLALGWAAVVLALAVSFAVKFKSEALTRRGVVVAESAAVRYGDGTHYSVKFTVHEGAELVVLDERRAEDGRRWIKGEFLVEVKQADQDEAASREQRIGWTPADAVEEINLPAARGKPKRRWRPTFKKPQQGGAPTPRPVFGAPRPPGSRRGLGC